MDIHTGGYNLRTGDELVDERRSVELHDEAGNRLTFYYSESCGTVEQPTPQGGIGNIQALVRQDLLEREQLGIERYGQPVRAFNGRSALMDAYQEALDLAVYLRQAIAEQESLDAQSTKD